LPVRSLGTCAARGGNSVIPPAMHNSPTEVDIETQSMPARTRRTSTTFAVDTFAWFPGGVNQRRGLTPEFRPPRSCDLSTELRPLGLLPDARLRGKVTCVTNRRCGVDARRANRDPAQHAPLRRVAAPATRAGRGVGLDPSDNAVWRLILLLSTCNAENGCGGGRESADLSKRHRVRMVRRRKVSAGNPGWSAVR